MTPRGHQLDLRQRVDGGVLRITAVAMRRLAAFTDDAKRSNDLERWRRGKAVLGYIAGQTVIRLAAELGVTRGSVNRWLQWYEADGTMG